MDSAGILPNQSGPKDGRTDGRNDEAILEQAFTNMLQQMSYCGLNAVSSKFFIVYAHDNPSFPESPANAQVVQKFISWFKKLSLDVDSDRSPHGWGQARGCEISGASNDILKNQMCLMPKEWDSRNVEWVIVFGSPLLGKYIDDERKWRSPNDGNMTYTEAILETCRRIDSSVQKRQETSNWIETVYAGLEDVQKRFSKAMGTSFHHVLTELALLGFRGVSQKSQFIIPVVLGAGDDKCLPEFILQTGTLLRESPRPGDLYKTFFKILRRFEDLEHHRPLVEEMEAYLKLCKDWLASSPNATREESLTTCSSFLYKAIGDILKSPAHRNIDRPITQFEIKKILNSHYYLSAGTITGVSGSSISSDGLVDINLVAALPRSGTKKPESQEPKLQGNELVAVGLDDLFSERVLPGESNDKRTLQPKRVLIRGPPGIGKSTLSKRLAYRYTSDSKLKRGQDLVICLPLRALEHAGNLEELFLKHFFSFDKRKHELARKLEELVLDTRKESTCKVLCILDGLDEARSWDGYKKEILLALVTRADRLIITSRFGAAGTVVVGHIELEFEALGLSMDGVQAYLTSKVVAFTTRDNTMAIGQYLETHPSMQDVVRVPIHLDMLCYSWGELRHDTNAPPTLTEIYQAISHKLWKKDIPKLSKYDCGEPVSTDIVDRVANAQRLIRIVLPEATFLGRLALILLSEARVTFTDHDITSTIDILESESSRPMPLSLERNLPKLSFIRRSSRAPNDRGQVQEYSFIHLSFLEFFAANDLVRNPDHLRATLSKHKYNRRYEVVWRFVAGLFAQVKGKAEEFFHLLNQEPRDLMGMNHVFLIMYCLDECSSGSLDHYLRRDIYDNLWDWVEFETSPYPRGRNGYRPPQQRSTVLASMAFPEDLLRDKVPTGSFQTEKLRETRFRVLSSEFCLWLVDKVEEAGFPKYALDASEMLSARCQPSLSTHIVQRLVDYWGPDKAGRDRKFEFARRVLRGRDLLRPNAKQLVDFLESVNSWSFQVEAALDVLLQQPTFCDYTFKFLGFLDPNHPPIKCLTGANTQDHRYLKCLNKSIFDGPPSLQNLTEELVEYLCSRKKSKIPEETVRGLAEYQERFPLSHEEEEVAMIPIRVIELILGQPSIPADVVTRLENLLLGKEKLGWPVWIRKFRDSEVPELREAVFTFVSQQLDAGATSDPSDSTHTLYKLLNFISPGTGPDVPKGSKFAIPQHLRLYVARFLGHPNSEVRYSAARALRRDPENWEAEQNIVRELKEASISHPWTVARALEGRGLDIISGEFEPVDWLMDRLEPLTRRGGVSDQGSGKNKHASEDLFTITTPYSYDDPVSTAAAHLRHLDMPWTRLPSQDRQENRRSDRMINLLICLLSVMGDFRQSEGGSLASLLRTAPLTSKQLGSLLRIAAEGKLPDVGFALQGRQDEATQTGLLNILRARPRGEAHSTALIALGQFRIPWEGLELYHSDRKAITYTPGSSNLPLQVLEACFSLSRASSHQTPITRGRVIKIRPRSPPIIRRMARDVLTNQENLPAHITREFLSHFLALSYLESSGFTFLRKGKIFELLTELDEDAFTRYLKLTMEYVIGSTNTGETPAAPIWIDRNSICRFDDTQTYIIKTPLRSSEREFRIKWLSAQKRFGIPQSAWIEAPPAAPGDFSHTE